jgi:hypothetical protein
MGGAIAIDVDDDEENEDDDPDAASRGMARTDNHANDGRAARRDQFGIPGYRAIKSTGSLPHLLDVVPSSSSSSPSDDHRHVLVGMDQPGGMGCRFLLEGTMMRKEEKDDDDVAAIATTDDDDGRWHDVRVLGQSRRGLPPAVGEGRAMRPSRKRHIIGGGSRLVDDVNVDVDVIVATCGRRRVRGNDSRLAQCRLDGTASSTTTTTRGRGMDGGKKTTRATARNARPRPARGGVKSTPTPAAANRGGSMSIA